MVESARSHTHYTQLRNRNKSTACDKERACHDTIATRAILCANDLTPKRKHAKPRLKLFIVFIFTRYYNLLDTN